MAAYIQQLRVRFSGIEEETQAPDNIKGRRIPIQKAQSFRDKKGGIKWLGRQIPSLMSSSSGYASSEDSEFGAAVAAAAYAITMLEEFDSTNNRKSRKGSEKKSSEGMERKSSEAMEITPLKIRSRKEETTTPSQTGGLSRRLSWKPSLREETQLAGETPTKKPEIATDWPNPENIAPAIPTVRKTPTLAEKKNASEDNSNIKPIVPMAPEFTRRRNETPFLNSKDKKASAWETSKLTAIRKRYEKVLETIRSWEDQKKSKAKTELERTQGYLEKRKEIAVAEYRNQMNTVNKIASSARSQADENRKKEELKVKEKADKIRLTGEIPRSCFCF